MNAKILGAAALLATQTGCDAFGDYCAIVERNPGANFLESAEAVHERCEQVQNEVMTCFQHYEDPDIRPRPSKETACDDPNLDAVLAETFSHTSDPESKSSLPVCVDNGGADWFCGNEE